MVGFVEANRLLARWLRHWRRFRSCRAAVSVGLGRDVVLAGMQDPDTKARLVREDQEAISRGVFGSPFFLVDGEPLWGSGRLALITRT
jgi:2-hydroxychromene-2-carboxylate isomerase